jgi:hypothetical protein
MKSHKRLTVADALGVGTWYKEVCRKNTTFCIGKNADAKKGQPKRRMVTRRAAEKLKGGQTSEG